MLIERPIPAGALPRWCLETWPLGAVAVAESLLAGAFAAGGAFAGGAFFGAVTCHRADCPLTGNCGAFLGGGGGFGCSSRHLQRRRVRAANNGSRWSK